MEVKKETITPYWEREAPETATAGKTQFRYFKGADKLQVCLMVRKGKNKQLRPCKAVTVDLISLRESAEVLGLIKKALF